MGKPKYHRQQVFEGRFWSNVDRDGPIPPHMPHLGRCWLWTGTLNIRGYGCIRRFKRARLAHRVAYELSIGPIPDGSLACHHCDNRQCVNPAHIFLGTHLDNSRDCTAKGRQPAGDKSGRRKHPERYPRGMGWPWAKLTDADVVEIRRLSAAGHSQRTIAKMFGVARTTCGYIIKRTKWKHVA